VQTVQRQSSDHFAVPVRALEDKLLDMADAVPSETFVREEASLTLMRLSYNVRIIPVKLARVILAFQQLAHDSVRVGPVSAVCDGVSEVPLIGAINSQLKESSDLFAAGGVGWVADQNEVGRGRIIA
jgi:hypothetical protein